MNVKATVEQIKALIAKLNKESKAKQNVISNINSILDHPELSNIRNDLVEITKLSSGAKMVTSLKELIKSLNSNKMEIQNSTEVESDVKNKEDINLELQFDSDDLFINPRTVEGVETPPENTVQPAPVEETKPVLVERKHYTLKELVPVLAPCVNNEKHPFVVGYTDSYLRYMDDAENEEALYKEKDKKKSCRVLPGCDKKIVYGYSENTRKERTQMMNHMFHYWELNKYEITSYGAIVNLCPNAIFFDFDPNGDKDERINAYNDFDEKRPKEGAAVAKTVSFGGRMIAILSEEFKKEWMETYNVNKVSFKLPNGDVEIMLACKPGTYQPCTLPDSPETFNKLKSYVYSKKIMNYGSYKWIDGCGWDQDIFLTGDECLKQLGWYKTVMVQMRVTRMDKINKQAVIFSQTFVANEELSRALIKGIHILDIHRNRYDRDIHMFNLTSLDQMIRGLDEKVYDEAWKEILSSINTSKNAKESITKNIFYQNPKPGSWKYLSNVIKEADEEFWDENIKELIPEIHNKKEKKFDEDIKLPIEGQKLAIKGLKGINGNVTITAETPKKGEKKEDDSVCIEHLLKMVNCLDPSLIKEGRSVVRDLWLNSCDVLEQDDEIEAEAAYANVLKKVRDSKSKLVFLTSCIKKYNKTFYDEKIKPLIAAQKKEELDAASSLESLHVENNEFTYETIQEKCAKQKYKSYSDMTIDLVKIFGRIAGTQIFVQKRRVREVLTSIGIDAKMFEKHKEIYESHALVYINRKEFEQMLEDLKFKQLETVLDKFGEPIKDKDGNERKRLVQHTALDVFEDPRYQIKFNINNIDWNSGNPNNLHIFTGYKYDPLRIPKDKISMNLIGGFLNHLKEVGYRGVQEHYDWFIYALAKKYQTVGKVGLKFGWRSEKQGTGKSIILDVIYQLFAKWAINLDDLRQCMEDKTSILMEHKLAGFVDEVPYFTESLADNDKFKNITQNQRPLQVRGMHKDFHETENLIDFFYTSNHSCPSFITNIQERRTYESEVDDKYAGDTEYFNKLMKDIQPGGKFHPYNPEFFYHLSSYLWNLEIPDSFNINVIPSTQARIEAVNTSNEDIDIFIGMYISEFIKGVVATPRNKNDNENLVSYCTKYITDRRMSKNTTTFKNNVVRKLKEVGVISKQCTAEEAAKFNCKRKTNIYKMSVETAKEYFSYIPPSERADGTCDLDDSDLI